MVAVFSEVKRVLKNDGTLWLNLGDSYIGGKGQSGSRGGEYQKERNNNGESLNKDYQTLGGRKQTRPTDNLREINRAKDRTTSKWSYSNCPPSGVLKPKDLVGIPWMTAFALRTDGWYLRQDIIWHKPNPMPESVTDRCTKSHEYIFLMAKSQKYYYDYDAIVEVALNPQACGGIGNKQTSKRKGTGLESEIDYIPDGRRNKRDVWTVNTKPYSEAHFATFPEKLIVDMIKAGCPKDGIILDPFMGAGTSAVVARKLNKNFIGFELNKDYITIADKRLYEELGMFL